MIRLLVEALRATGIDPGFFRLMDFLSFRALMGMTTALAVSLALGFRVTVFLYRRRFRDTSGEHGSINVASKRGTPTGGGLLILLAGTVAALLWCELRSPFLWPLLIGFVYLGMVGFLDDFLKVRFKSSLVGLSQLGKTVLVLLFVVPCAVWLVSPTSPLPEEVRTLLWVPFYKNPILDLGPFAYALFMVFAVFSIINAMNITDGMDGLLATTSVLTIGVYVVFAYVAGNTVISGYLLFPYLAGAGEVAVFGAILAGAVLGFLWFNSYPAQMFMGDTGSLSIGGAVALMAFLIKQEMLFPIVGGIFVLEIFTSLVQDKLGNRIGRRIVHRAPFHYSMAHSGVAEPKVVARLTILASLLAVIALLSLKIR